MPKTRHRIARGSSFANRKVKNFAIRDWSKSALFRCLLQLNPERVRACSKRRDQLAKFILGNCLLIVFEYAHFGSLPRTRDCPPLAAQA
jgi:hypothetical protein